MSNSSVYKQALQRIEEIGRVTTSTQPYDEMWHMKVDLEVEASGLTAMACLEQAVSKLSMTVDDVETLVKKQSGAPNVARTVESPSPPPPQRLLFCDWRVLMDRALLSKMLKPVFHEETKSIQLSFDYNAYAALVGVAPEAFCRAGPGAAHLQIETPFMVAAKGITSKKWGDGTTWHHEVLLDVVDDPRAAGEIMETASFTQFLEVLDCVCVDICVDIVATHPFFADSLVEWRGFCSDARGNLDRAKLREIVCAKVHGSLQTTRSQKKKFFRGRIPHQKAESHLPDILVFDEQHRRIPSFTAVVPGAKLKLRVFLPSIKFGWDKEFRLQWTTRKIQCKDMSPQHNHEDDIW